MSAALERARKALLDPLITETGCWNWDGAHTRAGYGVAAGTYLHRLSYEHFVGPIPPGLEIDHLCRNRGCYNPAHLEAVTHAENMRRGYFGSKTHCPQGHAYEGENVITSASGLGGRMCRECKALRRNKTSERRSKTHCVHGHPKEGNRNKTGHCIPCTRERQRAYKARKKAEAA